MSPAGFPVTAAVTTNPIYTNKESLKHNVNFTTTTTTTV